MADPSQPRLVRVAGRDTWHIYHQRTRRSTGCEDRRSAEAALTRYLAALRDSTPKSTVSEIMDGYVADRRDAQKPGADRLAYAAKRIKEHWGQKPPEAVTKAECKLYIKARVKTPVSLSTIRTELQALRAAMRWAKMPKDIEMPGAQPSRDRWLTRPEADALIAAASMQHIQLFILIGLHTGARAAAILGLTWARVDLEKRRINFREEGRAQTSKRRPVVPINETLLRALQVAENGRTTEHVIEWAGGRIASVKRGFRAAADGAGLHGITPHVLRHTAATWMAQGGVSLWDIAGMLGHGSIKMVEDTYGHHSPDHLKNAADSLG